jgi:hypothetical protein
MKTLADFKRVAVVGACFERSFPPRPDIPPAIREVTHRQSNAVCLGQERAWFHFPKASDLLFENGMMIILDIDAKPRLTLRHISTTKGE